MRLSNYVVKKQVGKEYILFSTISKKIIKITQEFYEELLNLNQNDLREIKPEELSFLKNAFFVIEDGVNEENLVEYLLDRDRLHQEIFSSYIAFSTICNFSCVYCYEEGQTERKHIMNDCVFEKTIEWYKSILLNNGYKKCKITLFGGEPLIHKDLIKKFVQEIFSYTSQNDIELKLAIITNGYLLEQDIVDFLDKYGLEEIQITIDGVGKIHDLRRPLKGGGPTFDKIMSNIKSLNRFKGRFLFRVSFDKDNILHVKELLEFLKGLNINNAFSVYLAPIHQTTCQNEKACSFCSRNTSESIDELIRLYSQLYTFMHQIGLNVPKYISNGPCMTVSNDTVLIDPCGKIYKCVEMIGLDRLCVGTVFENFDKQKLSAFVGRPLFKRCIKNKCKYVCICGGGCLMKSFLKDKTLSNLDCQYKLFDELIPLLLELNYGNN